MVYKSGSFRMDLRPMHLCPNVHVRDAEIRRNISHNHLWNIFTNARVCTERADNVNHNLAIGTCSWDIQHQINVCIHVHLYITLLYTHRGRRPLCRGCTQQYRKAKFRHKTLASRTPLGRRTHTAQRRMCICRQQDVSSCAKSP